MSLPGYVPGLPGMRSAKTATHRIVFRQGDWTSDLAQGKIINGTYSRDPDNTGDIDVLRPGLVMGKRSSDSQYAPSILGLSQGALTGTGTSITLTAAAATELVRRCGSTGTFKLTGPPTASGVSRTLTVTYSAVNTTTGVVTITALGVNAVQTWTPTGDASAGSFSILVTRPDGTIGSTGPLAFSASLATIQTALDLASGVANGVVITSVGSAAPMDVPAVATFTFSGTGFAGLPQPLVQIIQGTSLTGHTADTVVTATAGVNGAFVTNSLIQPTDGSETPLTIIPDGYGIKVTDIDNSTNLSVPFAQMPIAGVVFTTQLINYPSDTSIQAFLKNSISSAAGGKWVFDDVY